MYILDGITLYLTKEIIYKIRPINSSSQTPNDFLERSILRKLDKNHLSIAIYEVYFYQKSQAKYSGNINFLHTGYRVVAAIMDWVLKIKILKMNRAAVEN